MMFGIFTSAIKAATAVIDIPVAIIADSVTLGGLTNDRKNSYTGDAARRLVKNVSDMADPKS
jgi:hypothetical protein